MKLMIALVLALFSGLAIASIGSPDASAFDALIALLGDDGKVIAAYICVVGYGWAILRQFIKPERLSWLPEWVIDLLELAATNKGYAQNIDFNDPKFHKRLKPK
ncbi:hypothetical protein [Vibrio sp. TRT 17S01]|uniref:hypothetical protein n=1 Tax=Vibrio sp. TRT 17S01 TaxID=3418505 RepID=UPI003CF19EF0